MQNTTVLECSVFEIERAGKNTVMLVYLERMETSKPWIYDASIVRPYSLLLFGGKIEVHPYIPGSLLQSLPIVTAQKRSH